MSTQTPTDRYLVAFDAWQPGEDDRPEAIPYYRAAAGLKAAWGEDVVERLGSHFHACFCAAGSHGYRAALATLRHLAEQPVPSRPQFVGRWISEPVEVTAEDVFVEAFRRHYPGKRINSKLAKAKREESAKQAQEIADRRNEEARKQYNDERAKTNAQAAAHHRKWLDEVQQIAILEDLVREIDNLEGTE